MYDLKTFTFSRGSHSRRDEGMCIMEAVAYVAGEAHSDHPECACPVLTAFLINWNDSLKSDEERHRLLSQYVFRLPGTRADKTVERKRGMMALRWLVNSFAPTFLDLVPSLREHANNLRRACVNEKDLKKCQELSAAAWAAARDAAWDAARDAAGAAARAAAWAAAWDAAGDKLSPTVKKLQRSAQRLIDRMIRLTEPHESRISKRHQRRDLSYTSEVS